jgi:hypothetical protein
VYFGLLLSSAARDLTAEFRAADLSGKLGSAGLCTEPYLAKTVDIRSL